MRKLFVVLSLVIVTSLLLAACGTPTEAPVVTEPPVVEVPTEAPTEEPTEAPTEAPTPEPTEEPVVRTERKGGWLDEIVYTVADPAAVLTQIQAGDVDIYAEGLAPAFAQEVRDSGLKYSTSQGTYYGILFNPATYNDGRFNPFSNRKIREAFNWLTDRDYFAQEIFNGGGKAKFFAITTEWPDYADLADTVRKLESYYAYEIGRASCRERV